MLSLPKLVALAGFVWLVFYLFRSIEAYRRNAKIDEAGGNSAGDQAGNNASGEKSDKANHLDLEECSLCGAWVAGQPCDREECPYSPK